MIRYASDRDRHHRVLARDPAQVSMQSIPHLFPDCRLSSAGAEHQVNQARYVTMRHENQPSLTGLVFLAHCTQHWFGAGPSFSSCTACMRRTVLGYYQVVPAGLCATNSCDNSGAGTECTSYRTVCLCWEFLIAECFRMKTPGIVSCVAFSRPYETGSSPNVSPGRHPGHAALSRRI